MRHKKYKGFFYQGEIQAGPLESGNEKVFMWGIYDTYKNGFTINPFLSPAIWS